jgi:hypothetical protein
LEGQLSQLSSLPSKIQEYKEMVNSLNDVASNNAQAYKLLDQEVYNLRTSLRQIRDVALKYATTSCDVELAQSVVELVDSFLHTGANEPLDHRGASLKGFSPRFKKHIELMHSSDSESADSEDDDPSNVITSSTELMADLSLIATGRIPPSLCSPNVLEEAATLDDLSVFDRLANPRSFTGSQKYVQMKKSLSADDRDESQGQHAIEKDALHQEVFSCRGNMSTARDSAESALEGSKQIYQTVFDKLGSPSQYTGTHKEKFHDGKMKRDRSADETKEKSIEESSTKVPGEMRTGLDLEAYTKQNVFDRLQKTTTLAVAVRQSETLHLEGRSNTGTSNKAIVSPVSEFAVTETSSSRKSAAKRKTGTNDLTKIDSSQSVDQKLNVFERLNKTTTRAYAKKTSKQSQED